MHLRNFGSQENHTAPYAFASYRRPLLECHLSSVFGERRNHGNQRQILTLEEKIALHNVEKFKNSRSSSLPVSSKQSTVSSVAGSSTRTHTPAATQKKLRPIIKVRKENSCKPSQTPPTKVPVSPKKPISFEKEI